MAHRRQAITRRLTLTLIPTRIRTLMRTLMRILIRIMDRQLALASDLVAFAGAGAKTKFDKLICGSMPGG